MARTRFDIDALRALAGDSVFARGQKYHRDGQVEIFAIEPERVLARVAGTEDYRTELNGRGRAIGGDCSCPAFGNGGFCKHLVATALAANAAGEEMVAGAADGLSRIRDHLRRQGVDALVGLIMDLAERDMDLFRRLELAEAMTHGDDKTLEARLRKAIDSATRTRGFIDYDAAAEWADEVYTVLDALDELLPAGRADLALRLAERALDRVEQAIENIDDSHGHCGGLLDRAQEIHLAAAEAARPHPVPLARALFIRETGGGYGTFSRAAALYAEVLGEAGLAEYRRLATEAWAKLPSRAPSDATREVFDGRYRQLREMLDFFAEAEDDLDARIALRAKDLSAPGNYFELAEFCRSHGRTAEALRYAEEGLWLFDKGGPDERLLLLTHRLLSEAGRGEEAEALLWKAFEKAPSPEIYQALRRDGGDRARDRALQVLRKRAVGKTAGWRYHPANLLAHILIGEKLFDEAWAVVRAHRVSEGFVDQLARASEATHPAEALEVYADRVASLAAVGGNPNYEEAVKLLAHMAAMRSPAEQAAHVAELKRRFSAKRNFMKLLA